MEERKIEDHPLKGKRHGKSYPFTFSELSTRDYNDWCTWTAVIATWWSSHNTRNIHDKTLFISHLNPLQSPPSHSRRLRVITQQDNGVMSKDMAENPGPSDVGGTWLHQRAPKERKTEKNAVTTNVIKSNILIKSLSTSRMIDDQSPSTLLSQ